MPRGPLLLRRRGRRSGGPGGPRPPGPDPPGGCRLCRRPSRVATAARGVDDPPQSPRGRRRNSRGAIPIGGRPDIDTGSGSRRWAMAVGRFHHGGRGQRRGGQFGCFRRDVPPFLGLGITTRSVPATTALGTPGQHIDLVRRRFENLPRGRLHKRRLGRLWSPALIGPDRSDSGEPALTDEAGRPGDPSGRRSNRGRLPGATTRPRTAGGRGDGFDRPGRRL